jgi:hypothetical protein
LPPSPREAKRARLQTAPDSLPNSTLLCRTFAYGSKVRAQAGTDCFDIHPDQRLKRCAGLFDSEAQVTDPVAFLERLRHKSQYRAGCARALLARLSADLSDWLGWDVGGSLGRECAFEARWQATRAPLRRPAIVALDMGRHIFDASTRLDDPDPLSLAKTPSRLKSRPSRYSRPSSVWGSCRLPHIRDRRTGPMDFAVRSSYGAGRQSKKLISPAKIKSPTIRVAFAAESRQK